MIDPLDTAANYLDSGRLDDAETIGGTILNAKPDERSALYLMARVANARKAHGRALDYLARVENPELAHLYVEAAVAHRGLGAYGAAMRAAQQAVLLAPDAPTASRDRKTRFWIGDVWKLVLILRELRMDLNVFTISTPPSGLCVVSQLDRNSTILADFELVRA